MLSKREFYKLCLKQALKNAWGLFGHFRAAAAILAGLVVAFGSYRWIQGIQKETAFWLVVGPPALFLVLLIWQVIRAPSDLYNQAQKLVEQTAQESKSALERLKAEVHALKDDTTPLEFIYRPRSPYVFTDGSTYSFQVGVMNTGRNRAARNVILQLWSIEPTLPDDRSRYLPVALQLQQDVINPGDEIRCEIINVVCNPAHGVIWVNLRSVAFQPEKSGGERKRYIITLKAFCDSSPPVEARFELSFDSQMEPHVILTPIV
jgi:hypothetical protein